MKLISENKLILIKRLFKYVKPYIFKLILLSLCILSEIICSLLQPLLWGKIIQDLLGKSLELVCMDIKYFSAISILLLIVKFVESYLFNFLTTSIVYDLKIDMYNQILNFPIKIFDEISVGELISRLQEDTNSIATIITNELLTTIIDIFKIIIIGIAMIKINTMLSIIVLVTFPIYWIVFLKSGERIKGKVKELKKTNDEYLKNVEQTLIGIREVISLGIKRYVYNIFCDISKKFRKVDLNVSVNNQFFNIIAIFVNMVIKLFTVFVGAYYIINNTLTIQYFITFTTYSDQLTSSLMNVTRLNSTIQQVFVSIERIFNLMDNLSYEKHDYGSSIFSEVKGEIKFENVYFKYRNDYVIRNVTFNISPNSKVAIVGDSGSGKSTIFNLLLRFYDLSLGKIIIDDINIVDLDESSLRKAISIVRQEPFIFNLSIKENLLIGNDYINDQELIDVCKQVNIHDYIISLPEQYNTVISENSTNISGGQKQRLSIARAILKKSKIILFDEVTSGLDNISQSYIQEYIDKISKDHTVIVIAHRLSTIVNSDLIIMLNNGEIIGYGTHDKLMKENVNYRELYNAEFKSITE